MNKKIILTLIIAMIFIGCLSIVSADNSTNETSDNETVDMANYIMPISITNNGIEFSDGFTGFCLDSTKDPITADDGFESQATGGDEIQNYVKLAIIEAYKQGCEDNLGDIISSFADGSYKNSDNAVITEVLKSQESIGDNAVVELEDSIEGTFEFELLKSMNGDKSDCLAYTVSLKEMPNDDKLGATEDNATEESLTNSTDDEKTQDTADNETDEEPAGSVDNETDEKAADTTGNETDEKTNDAADNETNEAAGNDKQNKETIINETNKTIINKTNTLTINENNTTTINKNNNKIINKTNETPQNATIQDEIIKTVGNPIFLLVVVFAILAAVGTYMRKKG